MNLKPGGAIVGRLHAACTAALVCLAATAQAADPLPVALPLFGSERVNTYFADVTYDPSVPAPESILGFALGTRPVHYDQAVTYLRALADASPRAELIPMGATYEGRTLYYMVISSEKNLTDRETIRAHIASLADPPATGMVAGGDVTLKSSPVIAWMGYSIHGDELSGVDASLWVAYHLVAADDAATRRIRDSVLVLIDPSQNPDGRERFLAQVFSLAGQVPSLDAQSLQHDGFWPWGRGNHYLFDMNRDWLPLVLSETRARTAAILHWNPQLLVDAHEMWPFSSFLFSPPREPINPNITSTIRTWWNVFAADQGRAFDRHGWSYYTRGWYEEWYPGYTNGWCLYLGAVGILYEQAGVQGAGVKRPDGTTLTYARAVAQQSVSSLANLTTAADHRTGLLGDYARFHRDGAAGATRAGRGAFILAPSGNSGREGEFLTTLKRHGLRVERAFESFQATVISAQGERRTRRFPAGTYLVPLAQPRGLLAQAILEFDTHLSSEFLQEERRELEKGKGTRLYEVSSWSLSHAYALDISHADAMPGVRTEPYDTTAISPTGAVRRADAGYGFLLTTMDDRSSIALAALLEDSLQVRVAMKPLVHDSIMYAAGTFLLRRSENPPDLADRLAVIARSTGVDFIGVSSNAASSGPDLGSDEFELLTQPRIGLFVGTGIDFTSSGSLWYLLDQRLKVRHSLLDISQLSRYDLSHYNVLILPSYWGGAGGLRMELGPAGLEQLRTWVKAGGTLMALNQAAYFCADSASGLSAAREKGAVLEKLDEYDQAYQDERAAFLATVDTNAVWRGTPVTVAPKEAKPPQKLEKKELERRDQRARLFAPEGVIVRLDLNPEHWLNFGVGDHASALLYTRQALLAKDPVEAPARLATASQLRLSGLMWPEARERWAKTAYATRERVEKGQIVLFAGDPFFRAYFHGTKRLLENAILLGPGLGTSQPIPW
ncbi:MAG: M14 metallopeptidase family protein [Candidatus Zixiibacteriota bacterium]